MNSIPAIEVVIPMIHITEKFSRRTVKKEERPKLENNSITI
jgi:hypothetical protein